MQERLNDSTIKPRYYTTADIQVIMGCCGNTARKYAHQYLAKGQAIRKGMAILVNREVFDADLCEKDGSAQFFKVPLKVIEGGKATGGTSKVKRLEQQVGQLQAQLAALTAPKKRGRPRKMQTEAGGPSAQAQTI